MIDEGNIALVEMLFSFGIVLLWGFHQLWSLRRDRRRPPPADGKADKTIKP